MDILQDLNEQQKQAVTADPGNILVLAGPGSGKTRVLTRRIAYLVHFMGVRPYHILAVTFTNKAAREMRKRLEMLLNEQAEGLWLGTFHAACARILRREETHLPFDANYVIMDADDQKALVRRVLEELNLDEKQYRPDGIHAVISDAKNNLIWPEDYAAGSYREEVFARIYSRYQETLQKNNAVDFNDLLLWGVRLFEENPQVREQYARRFQHVLVDDFQDTNLAQYNLLYHLSSQHHNLFVVGDEDQSIYRWRGADYRNVMRFGEDYANSQKILLEENYRSTQTVLEAAKAVIDLNSHRTPKRLESARRVAGDHITLHEAVDDQAEAIYVVDNIRRWTSTNKARGSDFAVMYRTNAQSRLLEDAFMKAGLPYRLVGAQRFYGRREVKDVIAYLHLVHNPADEISLLRVINVPPRKIGAKMITELQGIATIVNLRMGDILISMGKDGKRAPFWSSFRERSVASALADFGELLASWHRMVNTVSLPALFDRVLEDTGYQAYLENNHKDRFEGIDRWENVQELRRLAYEYQDQGLAAFLEALALVSDQDTLPETVDAPTLLTLHAAKGLEFPVVFIIGLDDGLLPHSRSLMDPEEMAEERRLLYVGLTRAMDRLYLVRADRRMNYGSYEENLPSRFLEDIPDELIQHTGMPRRGNISTSQPLVKKQRSAPVLTPKYSLGMRVMHHTWGEGMVIENRIQDGEEMVDVEFESVGFKRLLAAVANLERIDDSGDITLLN